jgi:uncharacterized protein (TIGR02001 family)
MKKILFATALSLGTLLAPVSPVLAQTAAATPEHSLTGNLTLASEYRFRGISQTNGKPTVQGGFDYAHASGIYLGTWASNVSWLADGGGGTVSNSLEMDFYGGYKGSIGDIGYDVGLLRYYYPGSYPDGFTSPDTTEIYAAVSWKMLTAKYSHSLTNLFGFVDSKGSGYLDLGATFEIGAGLTLSAHVGLQRIPAGSVDGVQVRSKDDCSYTDWKLGVSGELAGLSVGVAYIDTNAKGASGECYRNAYDRDTGKGTLVLSVGKTF